MEKAVRRIGVFTSGGDAPGMNAAIRAVVRTSLHMGIECVGIRRGYHGLINGDFTKLTFESVSDLSRRGGTMLYSARSEEFKTPAGQEEGGGYLQDAGAGRPSGHRRRWHLQRPALPGQERTFRCGHSRHH